MAAEFDFIVVGSGSAGGVLAARLSESGAHSVACLEAGTEGPGHPWSRVPAALGFMFENPKVNWCYQSDLGESLGSRLLYTPAGKMLGGTSSLNGMIFNRGQRLDYDTWAAMGCRGWSYEEVLPFFRNLESTDIGSDQFRGRNGPIKVTHAAKTTPFFDLFIQSAKAIGLPFNDDYCGQTQYGVSMAQVSVHRGLRQSTATQYLAPASRRANLHVVRGAQATSVILDGKRCVGVRYLRGGVVQEVRARREVILCAGAFGTPKLLELSGIGRAGVLEPLGIRVVHELAGVGENLRDHYGATLQWKVRDRSLSLADRGRGWRLGLEALRYGVLRSGFISQGWCTMRVFTRSHDAVEQSDIALLANPYILEIRNGRRVVSPIHGVAMYAQVQRPESVGSAHIRSADARTAPLIRPSFLDTENDRRVAVTAVRRAREIFAAAPLSDAVEMEMLPGPQVQTDEQILHYIRTTGGTTYHYAGTCRMGHDPMAVVDDRLRVRGIDGLRVADASIMPTLVSGNTSAPCMMIGEKCADMLLTDAAPADPSHFESASASAADVHPGRNQSCRSLTKETA